MKDTRIEVERTCGFTLRDFIGPAVGVQFAPSAWKRLFGREKPSLAEIGYHELSLPRWQDVHVHVMTMRSLTPPAEAISFVGSCIAGYTDIRSAERFLHPWIICSVLRKLVQLRRKLPSQYFFYGRDIDMVPALAHIVENRAEMWAVGVYDQYALSIPAKSGLLIPRLPLG